MKVASDQLSQAVLRLDEQLSRQNDGGYAALFDPDFKVSVSGVDLQTLISAFWEWFDLAPTRPEYCRWVNCSHPECRCAEKAGLEPTQETSSE